MTPVIDTCDHGHTFAKIEGHPTKDGNPQCPNCMSIGLAAARLQLKAAREALEMAESWGEAGIETMDSETVKIYEELKTVIA
jgi:hypothetical protein